MPVWKLTLLVICSGFWVWLWLLFFFSWEELLSYSCELSVWLAQIDHVGGICIVINVFGLARQRGHSSESLSASFSRIRRARQKWVDMRNSGLLLLNSKKRCLMLRGLWPSSKRWGRSENSQELELEANLSWEMPSGSCKGNLSYSKDGHP